MILLFSEEINDDNGCESNNVETVKLSHMNMLDSSDRSVIFDHKNEKEPKDE